MFALVCYPLHQQGPLRQTLLHTILRDPESTLLPKISKHIKSDVSTAYSLKELLVSIYIAVASVLYCLHMPSEDEAAYSLPEPRLTRRRNNKNLGQTFFEVAQDPEFNAILSLLHEVPDGTQHLSTPTIARRLRIAHSFHTMHSVGKWSKFNDHAWADEYLLGTCHLLIRNQLLNTQAARAKDFLTITVQNSQSLINPDEKMHRRSMICVVKDLTAVVSKPQAMPSRLPSTLNMLITFLYS